MKLMVNGKAVIVEGDTTVSDLLLSYKLNADTVIVALNDTVIQRGAWQMTPVSEGDTIEIVSLVGGG